MSFETPVMIDGSLRLCALVYLLLLFCLTLAFIMCTFSLCSAMSLVLVSQYVAPNPNKSPTSNTTTLAPESSTESPSTTSETGKLQMYENEEMTRCPTFLRFSSSCSIFFSFPTSISNILLIIIMMLYVILF